MYNCSVQNEKVSTDSIIDIFRYMYMYIYYNRPAQTNPFLELWQMAIKWNFIKHFYKQVRLFLNENEWFYSLLTFSLTLPFSPAPSPPPHAIPSTILSLFLKKWRGGYTWVGPRGTPPPPLKCHTSNNQFKKNGRGGGYTIHIPITILSLFKKWG